MNDRMTSRQKMINLMYLVFIAMTALNITSDKPAGNAGIYTLCPVDTGNYGTNRFPLLMIPECPVAVEQKREKKDSIFRSMEKQSEPLHSEAAVVPLLTNILYAGIANPLHIVVSGVSGKRVNAGITGGKLSRKGNIWEAYPPKAGVDAIVTVTAEMPDGSRKMIEKKIFHVRSLPEPQPYISYKDMEGNARLFKNGWITKHSLLEVDSLFAAVDDGVLNVSFKVLGFELAFFDSMGNVIPEVSENAGFTHRQKEQIRRQEKGSRFFITRIRALGPDSLLRTLAPMEVYLK